LLGIVKSRPGAENLSLEEVDAPEPGPGQVVVSVTLAGICGSDLHIINDRINLNLRLPVVIGHEFVGRIVALGEGVTDWSVGERIVSETAFSVCGRCELCLSGHDNVCARKELIGYVHNGAFAELLLLPAHRLHKVPDHIPDSEVVLCEPLAGCVHGLVEQCTIRPGDVVLVCGPGSVGLISLQLARLMGAEVILAGRSKHRLALGAEMGAIATVDASDTAAAVQEIRKIVGDRGCDVFLECAGTQHSLELGLSTIKRRGEVLVQGVATSPLQVYWDQILYKELTVRGTLGQKWTAWERAIKLLASGSLKLEPMISDVLPLQDFARAFEIADNRTAQKVIFQPS
jgi:L-iditol 2-dehydrogenase